MNPTNATWIISDTHFGHKNIVKFQQRPETHDVIMLDNWIRLVGEEHRILHLGDVFLGKQGNPRRWARIISRLPGRKYLIPGNHDGHGRQLYEAAGFTILRPFIHRGVAFTHRPVGPTFPAWYDEWDLRFYDGDSAWDEGWTVNVHGHTHNNGHRDGEDERAPGKRYVNACVERTGLAPVQLGTLLGAQGWPCRS